ncbi:g4312 [Coccomyxa elongata]
MEITIRWQLEGVSSGLHGDRRALARQATDTKMLRPCFPLLKGRPVLVLLLVQTFICSQLPSNVGQPITTIRGYSPDQEGLLYIKHSIPNFSLFQRRTSLSGWADRPGVDVCTWSGVACNNNGSVTELDFAGDYSVLIGNIGDVLYGASLIPNLAALNLSNNAFTGTLPASLSMPNLQYLILDYNYIEGQVPAAWGANGAFPALQVLHLSNNPGLNGTLPGSWGADNSSMTQLQRLMLSSTNVTGSLPAQWAAQLPALQNINISDTLLTGTLPAEWSSLNLTYLKLDRNSLQGSIPGTWGANGSFPVLFGLSLYSNFLTGTLPAAWAVEGAMPALRLLDVSRNNLSGVVPSGWGVPGLSLFVTSGNRFCGPTPTRYQLFICPQFRLRCSRNATFPATCPAGPPPELPAPPAGNANDAAVLVRLQQMLVKYQPAGRSDPLWDPTHPYCSWIGVQCAPNGQVRALNFSTPVYAPPVQLPTATQPASVTLGVDGSVKADAAEFLTTISELPALEKVDMTNQWLIGTLPANISFPSLRELYLTDNDISGTLPAEWADNGAFPLLRLLALDYNWRLSGSLPSAWGRNPSSMAKLEVLQIGHSNFSGTLPESWTNQLPVLSIFYGGFNTLSGSLPSEWQAMNALTNFHAEGNNLTGTLPSEWGSAGAWPYLQEMNLDANLLQGTLPQTWGGNGSMPAIGTIILSRNQLTGSIPPSWGTISGTPRFPTLQQLDLLPGNPGLCGPLPSGLPVFTLDNGGQLIANLSRDCPGAKSTGPIPVPIPAAPAQAPAPATLAAAGTTASAAATIGGSTAHVGLIVGVVVGGCALIGTVLVALFLVLGRRRKERQRMLERLQHDPKFVDCTGKGHYCQHGSMHEGLHDSDSMIPPSNGGPPRSNVPYTSLVRVARGSPTGYGLNRPSRDRSGEARSGSLEESASSSRATGGSQATQSGSIKSAMVSPFASVGSPGGQVGGPKQGPGRGFAAESFLARLSLPQIMPLRDWELDLDKLEVEVDEEGEEVVLGRGGFGVVLKGTYRHAPVAIKRLKDQSPEQQEAFLKEMAILRACRGSRYIVPFVGASLLPGDTILAMDFMEGGNLWEALTRIGRNGQPIYQWNGRGRRVAHDVALGLHYLHDSRVVHLDLKSCNVLIAADGTAKISDVGMAALLSNNYLSRTAPAGTWAWVAPEVLMAGKVTDKADIFSFGVVLWEIITAERPTWRGNLREIRVPEEAPQEIADLVLRCTSDADARPDALECAQIINQFCPGGSGRRLSPQSATHSGQRNGQPGQQVGASGQLVQQVGSGERLGQYPGVPRLAGDSGRLSQGSNRSSQLGVISEDAGQLPAASGQQREQEGISGQQPDGSGQSEQASGVRWQHTGNSVEDAEQEKQPAAESMRQLEGTAGDGRQADDRPRVLQKIPPSPFAS